MKPLSSFLAERITASARKTVAVTDFTDLQGNVTELGRFLAEELSVALAGNARTFEVIDRTHLKALLQEHKLSATGLIDPQTARKLGQIAGVDALVTGTITAFGDSVRLSAKVLDTSTAKIIGASTTDVPKTKAIEELLGRGIGNGPETTDTATPSAHPIIPGPQIRIQKEDSFAFELKSCQRSGTTVTCRLSVINEGEDRNLLLGAARHFACPTASSRIFDDLGNEYTAEIVRLGNKENRLCVESLVVSGVPTGVSLTFEKVSANASKVALLEIGCFRKPDKQFNVQMRNIALGR